MHATECGRQGEVNLPSAILLVAQHAADQRRPIDPGGHRVRQAQADQELRDAVVEAGVRQAQLLGQLAFEHQPERNGLPWGSR